MGISGLTRRSALTLIPGVGTRDYYRKLGYKLDGPYMVKDLEELKDEDELEEEDEHESETHHPEMNVVESAESSPQDAPAADQGNQQGDAGPSQAAIAQALKQSSFRNKPRPALASYGELVGDDPKVKLCKVKTSESGRALYCTREGCGSIILSAGAALWTVAEGGFVRHLEG